MFHAGSAGLVKSRILDATQRLASGLAFGWTRLNVFDRIAAEADVVPRAPERIPAALAAPAAIPAFRRNCLRLSPCCVSSAPPGCVGLPMFELPFFGLRCCMFLAYLRCFGAVPRVHQRPLTALGCRVLQSIEVTLRLGLCTVKAPFGSCLRLVLPQAATRGPTLPGHHQGWSARAGLDRGATEGSVQGHLHRYHPSLRYGGPARLSLDSPA